jgi:hypothetical protein
LFAGSVNTSGSMTPAGSRRVSVRTIGEEETDE